MNLNFASHQAKRGVRLCLAAPLLAVHPAFSFYPFGTLGLTDFNSQVRMGK